MPWDKLAHKLVFRMGEVIVLAGINGHGKSEARRADHGATPCARLECVRCVDGVQAAEVAQAHGAASVWT
jgi:ABC-type sugar transport system ATPase subunit